MKRVVYGGGGIMPDIFVAADTSGYSGYFGKITQKGLVYQYAFDYSDKNRQELGKLKTGKDFEDYLLKRNILSSFIDYATSKGIAADPKGLATSGKIIEAQLMAYIARNIIGEVGFYSVISKIDATIKEAIKALDTKNLLVQSN
jgi:carboxyl-terminal processing protease